jgi:hypothetical protein
MRFLWVFGRVRKEVRIHPRNICCPFDVVFEESLSLVVVGHDVVERIVISLIYQFRSEISPVIYTNGGLSHVFKQIGNGP